MNFRNTILLSATAIVLATPALSFAGNLQPATGEAATAIRFDTTGSTVTRQQVLDELKAARMNGTLPASAEGFIRPLVANDAMGKTREQVKMELSASMGQSTEESVL